MAFFHCSNNSGRGLHACNYNFTEPLLDYIQCTNIPPDLTYLEQPTRIWCLMLPVDEILVSTLFLTCQSNLRENLQWAGPVLKSAYWTTDELKADKLKKVALSWHLSIFHVSEFFGTCTLLLILSTRIFCCVVQRQTCQ